MRRAALFTVLVLVGSLLAAGEATSAATVLEFTIEPGAAERVAAGEPVVAIPELIEARVGDRLVIANHDSEMHIVGPFTIGPGLVYDRVFTEPLILRNNFCTLHADAFVTVIVR